MKGNGEMECPVEFSTIEPHGQYLYGVTPSGTTYALYVYRPLLRAYNRHYAIPFAPNWHPYSQEVAMQYLPVPEVLMPSGDAPGFEYTVQSRQGDSEFPGDKIRSWNQTLYMGWPLYFLLDQPNPEYVERPLEFWLAEASLENPAADHEDGAPGPFIGP